MPALEQFLLTGFGIFQAVVYPSWQLESVKNASVHYSISSDSDQQLSSPNYINTKSGTHVIRMKTVIIKRKMSPCAKRQCFLQSKFRVVLHPKKIKNGVSVGGPDSRPVSHEKWYLLGAKKARVMNRLVKSSERHHRPFYIGDPPGVCDWKRFR